MSDLTPGQHAIIETIAAASDAIIAPEHESRLQRIEQVFKDWEPLLMKLATVAEKLVT